jgi:hypothetical protein
MAQPEEQLRALLSAFGPSEQRKMKARAFWDARKQKKRHARHAASARACPITLVPLGALRDPVVASDGAVYERHALQQWAQRSATSPLTRLPLQYGVPLSAASRALRDLPKAPRSGASAARGAEEGPRHP